MNSRQCYFNLISLRIKIMKVVSLLSPEEIDEIDKIDSTDSITLVIVVLSRFIFCRMFSIISILFFSFPFFVSDNLRNERFPSIGIRIINHNTIVLRPDMSDGCNLSGVSLHSDSHDNDFYDPADNYRLLDFYCVVDSISLNRE